MQQPGLSAAIRGIIWMTLACVFYALIYVVVRGLSDSYATTQIVFFRAVLGSVLMLPWLYRAGLQGLKTSRMGIYMWRMGFSYAGALGWMYGIAFLPLSEANALLFTMPLFTVAFAAIWLRERVGSHRWSATAGGIPGSADHPPPRTDRDFVAGARNPDGRSFVLGSSHRDEKTDRHGRSERHGFLSLYDDDPARGSRQSLGLEQPGIGGHTTARGTRTLYCRCPAVPDPVRSV